MRLEKNLSSDYDAGHGHERRTKKRERKENSLKRRLSSSLHLLEITPEKTLLL